MTDVSRRSLTRGAAWATPAIALGAAAPALAASEPDPDNPDFTVDCSSAVVTSKGARSFTQVTSGSGGRSRLTWNLGYLDFEQIPAVIEGRANVTGVKLSYGAVRVTSASGQVYTTPSPSTGLLTTPMVAGATAVMGATFVSDLPYRAGCGRAENYPVKFELDFCVTWLDWLRPVYDSQPCCYTLTQEFDPFTIFGCYQWSSTSLRTASVTAR